MQNSSHNPIFNRLAVCVKRLRLIRRKSPPMKITAEPTDAVRSYLAQIGAKGGSIKGAGKKRGDSEYYRALARKSAKARKKK